MDVYRITVRQFAADISGEGALRHGGRWNPPGVPVLYTAESVALAVLETLVNMPPDFLNAEIFCRVTVTLPDDLEIATLTPDDLPSDWQSYPAPASLAKIGREWIETGTSIGLKVPSVVTGGKGWNLLLNPEHTDFLQVKITEIAHFQFDTRLLKSR